MLIKYLIITVIALIMVFGCKEDDTEFIGYKDGGSPVLISDDSTNGVRCYTYMYGISCLELQNLLRNPPPVLPSSAGASYYTAYGDTIYYQDASYRDTFVSQVVVDGVLYVYDD